MSLKGHPDTNGLIILSLIYIVCHMSARGAACITRFDMMYVKLAIAVYHAPINRVGLHFLREQ